MHPLAMEPTAFVDCCSRVLPPPSEFAAQDCKRARPLSTTDVGALALLRARSIPKQGGPGILTVLSSCLVVGGLRQSGLFHKLTLVLDKSNAWDYSFGGGGKLRNSFEIWGVPK